MNSIKTLPNINTLQKSKIHAVNFISGNKVFHKNLFNAFIIIMLLSLTSCSENKKSNEIIDLMPNTIESFKDFILVFIGFKFYSLLIDLILRFWLKIRILAVPVNIAILLVIYFIKDFSIFYLPLLYGIHFLIGFMFFYIKNMNRADFN